MSFTTLTIRGGGAGNGVTTLFPYTYLVQAEVHLTVFKIVDSTSVGTLQVLTTDYTVPPAGINNELGGNIQMVVAPAAGETILILRKPTIIQESDFKNQGSYFGIDHEQTYDFSRMIDQLLDDRVKASLKLPELETPSDLLTILPSFNARKGLLLKFNPVTGAPEASAQSVVPVELIWEVRGLSALADNPFTRYRFKKAISFKAFDVNGLIAGTGGNQVMLFKRFPGGATVATVTLADGVRESETIINASFVAGEELSPEWSTIAPTTPLEDIQARARV